MVIAKRRNDCVDEAIKQKNKTLSEIVERELSREEKDSNYEVTYTLKDLNQVKDHLDLIKYHVWIRDNILVDNGRTVFNIPTRSIHVPKIDFGFLRYFDFLRFMQNPFYIWKRTVQRLTLEEREQRRQLYQQRRLERQIQRENQNLVTVRLPATVSPRQSPEQTTLRIITPPNNWDQLQNIRTFYQPLDFNLLNQQLAKAHLTTSQWMLHFEKVARSNAWDEAKKIRKYATYLEGDAEEWYDEIITNDMTDWAAWRAGFMEKYYNIW
ncbi:hypothetical protein Glove_349g43 [Diversispora epigaea]|uniref:Uncharacterized protein n=1 Tax=Diversispora epigaea TaxID=1348612 RepID=A0A397HEI2_9GLOM|nr:hypothetical protein Glove_349g43 [Diversispora epigaea]